MKTGVLNYRDDKSISHAYSTPNEVPSLGVLYACNNNNNLFIYTVYKYSSGDKYINTNNQN